MKKILFFMLLILSFAGSAFAAAIVLTTHTPSATAGVTVKGGSTLALAIAAPTPLIKCSTGVHTLVNYLETPASPGTATGYTIAARHLTGSKNFATSNSRTNIYWKQAEKITAARAIAVVMAAEIGAGVDDLFEFAGGWTSY